MNHMRLAGLQGWLNDAVRPIDNLKVFDRFQLRSIDLLLGQYCKSTINGTGHSIANDGPAVVVRHWELMEKYSADAKGKHNIDPFMITTSSWLQRRFLDSAGLLDVNRNYRADDHSHPQLLIVSRPGNRARRDTEVFIKRFIFAVSGGLSLVTPMVLMVLHKDILTTLLTVSVSVLLLSLFPFGLKMLVLRRWWEL